MTGGWEGVYFRWMGRKVFLERVIFTLNDQKKAWKRSDLRRETAHTKVLR